MKTLTAKSGLVITFLLVVIMVAYGITSQRNSAGKDACSTSEEKSTGMQTKLNIKGMRHLLDFYK